MIPSDQENITSCQTNLLASHVPSVIVLAHVHDKVYISQIKYINPSSLKARKSHLAAFSPALIKYGSGMLGTLADRSHANLPVSSRIRLLIVEMCIYDKVHASLRFGTKFNRVFNLVYRNFSMILDCSSR